MGQKSSKSDKEFIIPENLKLSTDISKAINIKPSPDEISRFKHIMNKKLNREFTPSQFSQKFQQNKKGVKHISSLISLIYAKNTNTYLKQSSNRTLYESVFDYNIIEKDSKNYEEFNKNMISQMGLFINGEQTIPKDNIFIPQLTTFKTNRQDDDNDNENYHGREISKVSINQEDPFVDKDSSHIKKANTPNDTDNENIIKAIQEIKESRIGQNYYNNAVQAIKKTYANQSVLENNTNANAYENANANANTNNNVNSPFVLSNNNESLRLTEEDEKKRASPNIDNQSVNLNLDNSNINNNNNNRQTNNTIRLKGRISKTKKKSHNKNNSKKQPLVNIKINLKDLIKQDVYENSSLFPKERFKTTMERKSRSRSRTPSPNIRNEKEFGESVNNLTTIKPTDISQININDGSFLELVDAFAQPNVKEEKRIHSRTPKKRTSTFENENQKAKIRNKEFVKMFNVTNKKSNLA